MRFRSVFLGDAAEIDLLVLTELHDEDGVLFLTLLIPVADRHDAIFNRLSLLELKVVTCDFARFLIRRASHLQAITHAAFVAKLVACALLMRSKLVDAFANKGYKSDTVSDELIIEY